MIYDTVVVGGGVMGLATAYSLLKRGLRRVIVLERETIGHDRAASTDNTKAIRYEYAEWEQYSLMVGRAIELWRELEARSGAELYVNSGVLCWGRDEARYARKSFKTLSRLGLPIREVSLEEMCQLYPEFSPADITYATVNTEGGFLRASRCVSTLATLVREMGGEIREGCHVTGLSQRGQATEVEVSGGERVAASHLVLAAGAWGASLLPSMGITLPLSAHKQQVMYISGLPDSFSAGRFPVFLNLDNDFYGFPLDEAGLLKVSVHYPGPLVDPDVPEPPNPGYDDTLRALVRTYIPRAAEGRVPLSRVCMYAMTPDEDFILDRVPGYESVFVAAGFSGHGFKFGPVIGDMMAALVLGERAEFSLEPFALSRFEASGSMGNKKADPRP
ncbi:MAG TPA: N-methyl-L-tryptophan oxidase [Chloroflexia bacterium]|nr:N-methyl-L-tryptophan oxidase [Chloroflexia bacterium]